MIERTYWLDEMLVKLDAAGDGSNSGDPEFAEDTKTERRQVDTYEEANLISSWMGGDKDPKEGTHRPALDLDVPVQLFESRDSRHYHLYIGKSLSWENYVKLLDVMAEIGLLEQGYVDASKERGMTFLRKPVVKT